MPFHSEQSIGRKQSPSTLFGFPPLVSLRATSFQLFSTLPRMTVSRCSSASLSFSSPVDSIVALALRCYWLLFSKCVRSTPTSSSLSLRVLVSGWSFSRALRYWWFRASDYSECVADIGWQTPGLSETVPLWSSRFHNRNTRQISLGIMSIDQFLSKFWVYDGIQTLASQLDDLVMLQSHQSKNFVVF